MDNKTTAHGPSMPKKARTTTACIPCAKARRKCDSTLPTCKVCDAVGRECSYRNPPGSSSASHGEYQQRARKVPEGAGGSKSVQNGIQSGLTSEGSSITSAPITADSIAAAVDVYARTSGYASTRVLLEQLTEKYKLTGEDPEPAADDPLSSMRSTLQDDQPPLL